MRWYLGTWLIFPLSQQSICTMLATIIDTFLENKQKNILFKYNITYKSGSCVLNNTQCSFGELHKICWKNAELGKPLGRVVKTPSRLNQNQFSLSAFLIVTMYSYSIVYEMTKSVKCIPEFFPFFFLLIRHHGAWNGVSIPYLECYRGNLWGEHMEIRLGASAS